MTGPKWPGKPRKNMRKSRDPLYGAAKAVKNATKRVSQNPDGTKTYYTPYRGLITYIGGRKIRLPTEEEVERWNEKFRK